MRSPTPATPVWWSWCSSERSATGESKEKNNSRWANFMVAQDYVVEKAESNRKLYFNLLPNNPASNDLLSMRLRLLTCAGLRTRVCGISQRYSAINQTGFSVVIQWSESKRARFTGRE